MYLPSNNSLYSQKNKIMRILSSILFLLLSSYSVFSQITLVEDLNPGEEDSFCPCEFATRNQDCAIELSASLTVAKLSTPETNFELYSITSNGIELISDINPGDLDSDITNMTYYNGLVYFLATDGNGHKIWVTDGTTEGTTIAIDLGDTSTGRFDYTAFLVADNGLMYFILEETLYSFDGTTTEEIIHSTDISLEGSDNRNSDAWNLYNDGIALINDNGTVWELLSVDQNGVQLLQTFEYESILDDAYGFAQHDNGLVFSIDDFPTPEIQGLYTFDENTNEISRIAQDPSTRVRAIDESSCLAVVGSDYILIDEDSPRGRNIATGDLQLTAGQDWNTAVQGSNILFQSSTGVFVDDIYTFYDASGQASSVVYTAVREAFSMIQIGPWALFAGSKPGSFSEFGIYRVNLFEGDLEEIVDLGDPVPSNGFYKPITVVDDQLYFFATLDNDIGTEIYSHPLELSTSVSETREASYTLDVKGDRSYAIGYEETQNLNVSIVNLAGQKTNAFTTQTNTSFDLPRSGIYLIHVTGEEGEKTFKVYSN